MSDRSTPRDETGQPDSRLRPDNPGQVFGAIFGISTVSFFLSLVGLAVYLWRLPGESPTVTMADPPVVAVVSSWVGIVLSLVGYSVWSVRQLRGLSRSPERPTGWSPVKKFAYVLAVFIANPEDLDAYDRRLRWTVWAVFLGVFALLLPVGVLYGDPGRAG